MTNPRRTGLRRLWYVASWRCRYWYLDTREGLVARIVLALGLLVAAVWSAWASLQQMQRPPVAGEPIKAIADWIVYAIVFVVSLLVAYALAPKPQSAKPQKIEVARVEDGATLKRIYGPVWITDPVVIGDKPMGTVAIRKKAGKSLTLKTKWQTVGYWYKRIFHFMLCRGPIDSVLAIRAGDKEVWSGELGESSNLFISRLNLWGGEDSEGGIEGVFEFKFGDADQEPSAYLAANLAPEQSAYRGRASVVFQGGRWGNSPYFKSPAFLVSRILEGWDNDECWYPEKAEVPLAGGDSEITDIFPVDSVWKYRVEAPSSTADYSAFGYDDADWAQGEGGFGNYPPGWSTPPAKTLIPYELGEHVWIRRTFDPVPTGHVLIITVWADNVGRLWFNGEEVPLSPVAAYRYEARIPASGMGGMNVVAVKVTDLSISYIYAGMALSSQPTALVGMNPAHVLYDSLSAREMDGEPVALIDDTSWRAAADRLYAEGFGIGTEYDASSETIEQFQQRLCDLIGAQLSRDPTTGLWHLDLIRDDIGVDDLPVLTDDDILEFERQPAVLDEAVNQVVVEWFDPLKKESRSTAPLQALGAIQAFGSVNGEVRTFREILNEALALRVGARDLRVRSTPLERLTASTTRVPYSWRKGRKFRLQAPKKGIADMVCVLGEVDRGTLRSGALRITAVQDVASMPDTTYVVGESGVDTSEPTVALPALAQRTFETPYRDVAQVLTDAEMAYLTDAAGFTSTVAMPSSGGFEYRLDTRKSPAEFEEVGAVEWCPTALVVEENTLDDDEGGLARTSFTLSSPFSLASVQVGTAALWGDEMVRVDGIDPDALTVTFGRGCGDTLPQEHAAGERVWFYDGYEGIDPVERVSGDTIDAKVITRTGSDELASGAGTISSTTLDSRQARPYPPHQLQLNGEATPTEVSAPLTFTWVHRDRIAQGESLVAADEPSVGPEPGTTYTLLNLDGITGAELYREEGIVGDTHELPIEYVVGFNRTEVFAVRDGLESRQRASITFAVGFEIEGAIGKVIAKGAAYSAALAVPGAAAPLTWTIEDGSLPPGWSLGDSTIEGTATTDGDYQFLIQCEDANGSIGRRWATVKIATAALAMPATGADGSTTFTDLSGKTWTQVGSLAIDTDDADFPAGALLFPTGAGNGLRCTHADFAFGVADYTMQATMKPVTAGRDRNVWAFQPNAGNTNNWAHYAGSTNIWWLWNMASNIIQGASVSNGVKQVQRYSREQMQHRMYRDGAQQGSTVFNTTAITDNRFGLGINIVNTGGAFAGHLAEILVVRGIGLKTLPLQPLSAYPLLVAGDVGRAKSYWRVLVTNIVNPTNKNAALAELEFRATAGGPDQVGGGTPIADSQWDATYAPSRAFDGSQSTYWSSVNGRVPYAWIGYQFPVPVEVNAVAIRALNTGAAGNNEPMAFTVQSSDDGEVWFDEWSVTVPSNWTTAQQREFARP